MKNYLVISVLLLSSFVCLSQNKTIDSIDQAVSSIKKEQPTPAKTFKIPPAPDSSGFMNVQYFNDSKGAICKIEQEVKDKGAYRVSYFYFQNNELIKIETSSAKENFPNNHISYYYSKGEPYKEDSKPDELHTELLYMAQRLEEMYMFAK